MSSRVLLLTCLAATLVMTGVDLFVQVVHYPLFDHVPPEVFRAYHAQHSRRTTWVVVLPMVVELATSGLLVVRRPAGTSPALAWAGFAAAVVTWVATGALSVPRHEQLARGFDPAAHHALVATDRVRLAAWVIHSLVLLRMAAGAMA